MSDYVIERTMVGHLQQEEIDIVRMPRARFLAIVGGLLDEDYPELRDKLWPVAETMPSYPLGEWINEIRGCGCVVGEYLVATSELGRAGVVGASSVEDLISEDPQGDLLLEFGEEVDGRLRDEVRALSGHGLGQHVDAVLIEDGA